jgi:hypothetical protein
MTARPKLREGLRPKLSEEVQLRVRGMYTAAEAVALARRNLPRALAELVISEVLFHAHAPWLGMPPKLVAVIDELRDMDAARATADAAP